MLVRLPQWRVEMGTANPETGEVPKWTAITLEKFVEVAVPRNSHSAAAVEKLRAARTALEKGEVVIGDNINLKGLRFRRADEQA